LVVGDPKSWRLGTVPAHLPRSAPAADSPYVLGLHRKGERARHLHALCSCAFDTTTLKEAARDCGGRRPYASSSSNSRPTCSFRNSDCSPPAMLRISDIDATRTSARPSDRHASPAARGGNSLKGDESHPGNDSAEHPRIRRFQAKEHCSARLGNRDARTAPSAMRMPISFVRRATR
jgi:hypothetical protein